MKQDESTPIESANGSDGCDCKKVLDLLSLVSDNTVILKEELEKQVENSDEKISRLIVLIDESFKNIKALGETSIKHSSTLIVHGDKLKSLCNQITFLGTIVAIETAYILYKFL